MFPQEYHVEIAHEEYKMSKIGAKLTSNNPIHEYNGILSSTSRDGISSILVMVENFEYFLSDWLIFSSHAKSHQLFSWKVTFLFKQYIPMKLSLCP